ncbi:MAG: RDD family protein [Alphaproteobacteria bacterium]|jgi:uncharacterized RDD family membrane protein YckC|nr:RDD family protein [Alphaproteobacteria bacterium]
MPQQTIIPPITPPVIAMDYAGVTSRLIAMVIDRMLLLIMTGVVFILLIPVIIVGGIVVLPFGIFPGIPFTIASLYLVLAWLYFATMDSSARGATYGKRLMGLRVVGEDGLRISFTRATVRYGISLVSATIFLLGYLMAFVTSKRQTLHDMVAESVVIVPRS